MAKLIHLEGTTLEGGGQLLRIAVGLSSLTKIPINITNIRGKRSGGGGLKTQHLTSVQWLGQASKARLSGAGLKSKEITFRPNTNSNGLQVLTDVHIKQSTPGSINLVFQAILPYILFSGSEAPVRIKITGGTNVSNSPSFDYISQVLLPVLAKIGVPLIDSELHTRGWSTGGTRLGSVTYTITPLQAALPAFQLIDRGEIQSVTATVLAPRSCERHFREELEVMFDKRATHIFGSREPEYDITFEDSHNEKRYHLLLVATTTTGVKLGRDWLYDHGFRAGKVDYIISSIVKKVASDLVAEIEHGGCADEYLRDQLVVFQALSKGRSQVNGGMKKAALLEPSLHAKTAQWVVNEMLGVEFDEGGACDGIGLVPGKGLAAESDVAADEELARDLERLNIQ
ncbi:RNA 3'-terminal phosphate cyclase domain-containing protein [Lophiotrema nucula]|uniref:RNA 3'-terminal phosphate cyclase domain-containing protein n=1 Tax=Lophiotrema nucula TaxID=690887 RepID=A0A6A5Z6G5_9PLEO|nr:RNA 3'-terminal phosphate cyclase domain-containing protein [Lophiotrema nucula]